METEFEPCPWCDAVPTVQENPTKSGQTHVLFKDIPVSYYIDHSCVVTVKVSLNRAGLNRKDAVCLLAARWNRRNNK